MDGMSDAIKNRDKLSKKVVQTPNNIGLRKRYNRFKQNVNGYKQQNTIITVTYLRKP